MARDPGSLWSPLPESGRQGSHVKTEFIVHSTGDRGSAAAIYNYFARPDIVVESSFVIGLSPADPTRQLLDSSEIADANLNANGPAISVECVGQAGDPFTEWQVAELIRLGRWARANHPIAARICQSPTDSGFGWHVMFGSPGPWTPVAKDCPGRTRIQQLKDRVFPAIFDVQEDDMFDDNDRALLRDAQARLRGDTTRNYDMLQSIESIVVRVEAAVAKLQALPAVDLAAVTNAVKGDIATALAPK